MQAAEKALKATLYATDSNSGLLKSHKLKEIASSVSISDNFGNFGNKHCLVVFIEESRATLACLYRTSGRFLHAT